MKRTRGFTLVGVLMFAAFILMVTLATLSMVDAARARLARAQQRAQAALLATSGIDYARHQVSHQLWHAGTAFRSPRLDNGGWFEVDVLATPGNTLTLRCSGHFARCVATVEKRIR